MRVEVRKMDRMADDEDLAAEAADGDAAAFRLLIERHYDRVYRLAYRFSGNRHDAEDLAQEICVALATRLRSYRREARFSTWLYRVVVNAAHDLRRRQAGAIRLQKAYAEAAELARGAEAAIAAEIAWLYEALEQVGPELRATAILVLAEGLSHAEAAVILEVKEATVSWRMHELKKKLKALAGMDA